MLIKNPSVFTLSFFIIFLLGVESYSHHQGAVGQLVLKHDRKLLTRTEYGEISAVILSDGNKGPYHLQFITLEPNSLFLPVLLHADMVFYVHTGSGTLSWTDDDDLRNVDIRKGDIYRLPQGSVFYVQSSLETERERLRIYAIFTNTEDDIYEPSIGAYSSLTDVVSGFDSRVLQAAFKVPAGVIEEIKGASKAPAIIQAVGKEKMMWQDRLLRSFLGSNRGGFFDSINGKHKKKWKAYNVFEEDPDFDNCNGWSLTVGRKELDSLKRSNIGVFMVNLTKGSMMAPHWNPRASEISIVLEGQGMIRVVCSSSAKKSECRNIRYRVQQGDVFSVPRFHPMAQMSFNNGSFVFMGFSTSTTKTNHPQFLAGKKSTLGSLDRQILALSFNVSNTTIDQLLTPQEESVILDCTSCAEEEEKLMEEEIERERKEEEEARKRREEEEEARRRKEEEEEARKREEEEEEEEARKRREEEEEARRRKEEEEEARKREEEEARKRREEEEAQRRKEEEEEEARKREEEEAARRKEEEEEEARRRKEEEARREQDEAQRQEEERRKRQEEEAARRREEEEQEEAREREEAARQWRKREEEEAMRRKEEEARREQEEAQRQEEERRKRQEQEEEARRREEEVARRKKEEEEQEAREREEEAARRREEEEQEEAREREQAARQMRKREEEEAMRRKEEARREQEEAQRQEEEKRKREEQEEEARRREEEAARRREEEEQEARKREEEASQWRKREREEAIRRREEEARREQEEAQRQEAERRKRTEQEEETGAKEGDDKGRGRRRFLIKAWEI